MDIILNDRSNNPSDIIPLMQCGHTANGRTSDGRPVCVICVGIVRGASIVVDESSRPSLENRTARCSACGKQVESKYGLAFFEYKGNDSFDEYYCGCEGWE